MRLFGKALGNIRAEHSRYDRPVTTHVDPYGLFKHFSSDDYASAYPSIRAITNEYMTIRPMAVNANGKPVDHPALKALYHPNKKDSSVAFAEKVAVSTLALPMTYILVWRNEGGVAKPGAPFSSGGMNIAGYTFLENPAISIIDKKVYYTMGSQRFSEDEVMALPGGVTPDDLYAGYSPTVASKRWATLDTYIADYQKGFFKNGAIPAGMFVITASTVKDFEDTKATMQSKHRGAGQNNNVSYVPRPIGQDGKPGDAKIEWVPFAQSNKDIDFEPLLKHVDDRLAQAYGVSSIITGVDSNAKYSNAEVSENGFAKRAVNPLALRNYTQITHELNRITGGLGVSITYKYVIPAISDQDLVRSKTKEVDSKIILTMTAVGYTVGSVVDAFGLSVGYKLLSKTDEKLAIDNNKGDVDDGDEVDGSPDPDLIDGFSPLNGGREVTNPKAKLSDLDKLKAHTRKYMKAQIDRVIAEFDDEPSNAVSPDSTEDEIRQFIDDMLLTVSAIMLVKGEASFAIGIDLLKELDIPTEHIDSFVQSQAAEDAYRGYLRKVGEMYGQETAASIRTVLADANENGLTRSETQKALRDIMNTDEWRVDRMGRTELNRSQGVGSVEGMKQINNQTEASLEKSLNHPLGAVCEFCKALEGVWVAVDQPLIGLGDSVTGVDGGVLVNDFVENDGYDPHPNGKGAPIYRVVS